ncbi:hypothetical protein [Micromonospora deserti]|uniref:Uncharacterized protein n=1 Tax=Micromonospora deserti TaxID=2070366 RepID=A0A2W2CRR6_9ACTN|nr:hypothetical protein [Micromonospora deserti]PZG02216.1 hypothetical protein C1I99_03680 [Micromonospora deserti]
MRCAFSRQQPGGDAAHWIYTAMDTIRGILLTSFAYDNPGPRLEASWQRVKIHLRTVFDATFNAD